MLRRSAISLFMLFIFAAALGAMAYAESASPQNDAAVGAGIDYTATYKGIAKVKPPAPTPVPAASSPAKVKPFSGVMSGFEGLSRYNPVNWGPECVVPIPAKGQFLIGPKLFFARIRGDARKDIVATTTGAHGVVDLEDHLGFKRRGNMIWSIEALYQFRPQVGLRYSFTPMTLEASGNARTAFTFGGQSFSSGALVRSKWERFQHRAGILYNISYTTNSLTSFYADWLHIEDKLVVGGVGTGNTATAPVIWNDSKNLALLGLEFSKGLRNYRGNTLSLDCKAGIAFLDDSLGYEAEAGLTYLIPIKTGRFGFVKGGYQYMSLKTERNLETFNTSMDGAFVKIGFLF